MNSVDLDDYGKILLRSDPLRRPAFQRIIASLSLPTGSHGLDIGCGIGLQAISLAKAVGPGGHITGMDTSAGFLEAGKLYAIEAGMAERITFKPGSWDQVPSPDASFDWVWSADGAGYAPNNPLHVIRELARLIRSGGRLILLFWSSQCLLPGHPDLEARLNATKAGIAPFTLNADPADHYMRCSGWMKAAGLVDVRADTIAHTVYAPLGLDIKSALDDLFAMRWGSAREEVPEAVWQTYKCLVDPASPDYILNSRDYCAYFTYTVFSGFVPGSPASV